MRSEEAPRRAGSAGRWGAAAAAASNSKPSSCAPSLSPAASPSLLPLSPAIRRGRYRKGNSGREVAKRICLSAATLAPPAAMRRQNSGPLMDDGAHSCANVAFSPSLLLLPITWREEESFFTSPLSHTFSQIARRLWSVEVTSAKTPATTGEAMLVPESERHRCLPFLPPPTDACGEAPAMGSPKATTSGFGRPAPKGSSHVVMPRDENFASRSPWPTAPTAITSGWSEGL